MRGRSRHDHFFMITAGFTLIGGGGWSGGETYLRNMLGVISRDLAGRVQAKLFLSPQQAEKIGSSMDHLLVAPPIVDASAARFGRSRGAVLAFATGADTAAARLLKREDIDVLFEPAQFYGWRFPLPVVSWLPDFQHRHLAHLFSASAWWRRDVGFRLQTSARRVIMLSSFDAQRDCETFYPASIGKTMVVRFAVDLDPGAHAGRHAEITGRYGLPDRYFYLPNQFWTHKNHGVVVRALALIASRGELAGLPPVVLTGRSDDPRNPGHFAKLMAEASAAGLAGHFRHLGLVPYDDVFGLNASAEAVINPSLFEGWSTTVEEAKALGTPMILSAIGVHREQAPDACFFRPDGAEQLAEILLKRAVGAPIARRPVAELRAAHAQRRRDYADALLATFARAVTLGSGR